MAIQSDDGESRWCHPPPNLRRRRGERVAGHLFRVREEFNKFREWKEQLQSAPRPPTPAFHWDPVEDSDDDAPRSAGARAGGTAAAPSRTNAHGRLKAASLDNLLESHPLVLQWNYAFEQLHREAIAEIEEGIRLYYEPESQSTSVGASRAWRALLAKHQRVPKMQSPWEPKTVERQVRHLRRAYSSSSTLLPSAARAAQRGEFYHREEQSTRRESMPSPGITLLRRMGLEQRMGGKAGAAAGRKVVEGWLKQLAEDYPEDFCNLSTENCMLKDVQARLVAAQEDCSPEHALICSDLWVLRLHGDPMKEHDWRWRKAWLSPSGRLWLGPLEGEGGEASVQLSGDLVSNWYVMRARRTELVEALEGQRVYAFRIDSPMAKYQRRKLFASSNEELVEEWIKLCLTPPRPAVPGSA